MRGSTSVLLAANVVSADAETSESVMYESNSIHQVAFAILDRGPLKFLAGDRRDFDLGQGVSCSIQPCCKSSCQQSHGN